MDFFDREDELAALRETARQARKTARFTVLTGRRRTGKTTLLQAAYDGQTWLYFFVARRSAAELCANFTDEIEAKLGVRLPGKTEKFAEIFRWLMDFSRERSFTLVIDEFQEFLRVDPGVYSEIQREWDLSHRKSRINLVVCGSVHSLMNKIFRDNKEPLYGRQTSFMRLEPFTPSVLREILGCHNPKFKPDDLLALYAVSGGVAKYVELLMDSGATTRAKMLNEVFSPNSSFLEEGRILLADEFGKDYGNYFSVLSAIARGVTTRPEMEQTVGIELGGHLSKLEKDYRLIEKVRPMFAKETGKNLTYRIRDRFFALWFRFVAKYNYMVETRAFANLRALVERDWNVFSGIALERFVREEMIESGRYTRIGTWWDRKGENEIDLIGENELEKTMTFVEVKRDVRRYNEEVLRRKVEMFLRESGAGKGYQIACRCASLADLVPSGAGDGRFRARNRVFR